MDWTKWSASAVRGLRFACRRDRAAWPRANRSPPRIWRRTDHSGIRSRIPILPSCLSISRLKSAYLSENAVYVARKVHSAYASVKRPFGAPPPLSSGPAPGGPHEGARGGHHRPGDPHRLEVRATAFGHDVGIAGLRTPTACGDPAILIQGHLDD